MLYIIYIYTYIKYQNCHGKICKLRKSFLKRESFSTCPSVRKYLIKNFKAPSGPEFERAAKAYESMIHSSEAKLYCDTRKLSKNEGTPEAPEGQAPSLPKTLDGAPHSHLAPSCSTIQTRKRNRVQIQKWDGLLPSLPYGFYLLL